MATATEPTLTMREGIYVRKRDGMRVKAGDWSDGQVSWMIHPLPMVHFGKAVSTCSLKTFERNHEALEVVAVN